jgi:hypothetical protein
MPYLDVSPMMSALRRTPHEFEFAGGWLNHIGSSHSFRFGPGEHVEIRAACNCSLLAVRPDQLPELSKCFREWDNEYWRPLQINREFASHFAGRSALRRTLIALTGQLYSWLVRPPRAHHAGAVTQTR